MTSSLHWGGLQLSVVLSWYPRLVGNELLPQVMDFKYFGVLFMSEKMREMSMIVKLSIYWLIYASTLTYNHERRVVTETMRLQATEMTFFWSPHSSHWNWPVAVVLASDLNAGSGLYCTIPFIPTMKQEQPPKVQKFCNVFVCLCYPRKQLADCFWRLLEAFPRSPSGLCPCKLCMSGLSNCKNSIFMFCQLKVMCGLDKPWKIKWVQYCLLKSWMFFYLGGGALDSCKRAAVVSQDCVHLAYRHTTHLLKLHW